MHRLWYIAFPNQCKLLEGLRILLLRASSHVTPFFSIYMAQKWKDDGALVCVMYGKIVGMIFEQLYVFVKTLRFILTAWWLIRPYVLTYAIRLFKQRRGKKETRFIAVDSKQFLFRNRNYLARRFQFHRRKFTYFEKKNWCMYVLFCCRAKSLKTLSLKPTFLIWRKKSIWPMPFLGP